MKGSGKYQPWMTALSSLFLFFVPRSLGAKVQLMDQAALKEEFPWMNVEDVEIGSYGRSAVVIKGFSGG